MARQQHVKNKENEQPRPLATTNAPFSFSSPHSCVWQQHTASILCDWSCVRVPKVCVCTRTITNIILEGKGAELVLIDRSYGEDLQTPPFFCLFFVMFMLLCYETLVTLSHFLVFSLQGLVVSLVHFFPRSLAHSLSLS